MLTLFNTDCVIECDKNIVREDFECVLFSFMNLLLSGTGKEICSLQVVSDCFLGSPLLGVLVDEVVLILFHRRVSLNRSFRIVLDQRQVCVDKPGVSFYVDEEVSLKAGV